MSKRKYDHLRVRKNEERRMAHALLHPEYDPTEPQNELHEIFGPTNLGFSRILDEQDARSIRKTCTNGNCTVVWDPKTRLNIYSFGPAGCCDE